jgi:site-specific DNA-methyltransferase (adenine-specific)
LEPLNIGDCALYHGDCYDALPALGKADLILTDPPYGCTECAWDKPLDLSRFWKAVSPLREDKTPVLVFCAQPFTTDLIQSNRREYRYNWYWVKNVASGFLLSHKMPLRALEEIAVFYRSLPTYNPQLAGGKFKKIKRPTKTNLYGDQFKNPSVADRVFGYPTNVLDFLCDSSRFATTARSAHFSSHPTQKPVSLLSYLILTYTNPGGLVLDPFMGSGSAGVACVQTGRRFIGIEKDADYFALAAERVRAAAAQGGLDFAQGGERTAAQTAAAPPPLLPEEMNCAPD